MSGSESGSSSEIRLRSLGVGGSELREALGVAARGFGVGGKDGLDPQHLPRRHPTEAERLSERGARTVDDVEELAPFPVDVPWARVSPDAASTSRASSRRRRTGALPVNGRCR